MASPSVSVDLAITCKRRELARNKEKIRVAVTEYHQILARIDWLERHQSDLITELSKLEQLELPFD